MTHPQHCCVLLDRNKLVERKELTRKSVKSGGLTGRHLKGYLPQEAWWFRLIIQASFIKSDPARALIPFIIQNSIKSRAFTTKVF